jgi:hypothetical protein
MATTRDDKMRKKLNKRSNAHCVQVRIDEKNFMKSKNKQYFLLEQMFKVGYNYNS